MFLGNRRGAEEDTSVRGFPPLRKVSVDAEIRVREIMVILDGKEVNLDKSDYP
jgi:hypothetical protein